MSDAQKIPECACGERRLAASDPFCPGCWHSLPRDLRIRLFKCAASLDEVLQWLRKHTDRLTDGHRAQVRRQRRREDGLASERLDPAGLAAWRARRAS